MATGSRSQAAAAVLETFEPDEGIRLNRTRADISEIAEAVYRREERP